ncbi:hypothetical protein BT96DRAFT_433650 [Gymnopus androsaceus JB14]|uniref:Uncharacterized protein n=1 Tax=Gymnopus androsaceus JB14 TaxID=1447944 RepID=A0A6A4I1J4_9AGAR|nr:hypothetical protein BT96DRAFT_433650 [Gymnopus androsaceus JB14]
MGIVLRILLEKKRGTELQLIPMNTMRVAIKPSSAGGINVIRELNLARKHPEARILFSGCIQSEYRMTRLVSGGFDAFFVSLEVQGCFAGLLLSTLELFAGVFQVFFLALI